jgi:hypothetical protein
MRLFVLQNMKGKFVQPCLDSDPETGGFAVQLHNSWQQIACAHCSLGAYITRLLCLLNVPSFASGLVTLKLMFSPEKSRLSDNV